MKKYIFANKYLAFLVLMFNLIVSAGSVYIAVIVRDIINYAIDLNLNRFYSLLLFAVVYFLSLGAAEYFSQLVRETFRVKVVREFREDVFGGFINQDVGQFSSVNSADYISMLTNDVQLVDENYLSPFISVIFNVAQLLLSLALMVYFSPLVTIAVVICVLFLIVIPNFFSPGIQKRQNRLSQSLSSFTIKLKDVFSGFEVVKSYQMEKYTRESFSKKNNELYNSKLSLGYIYAAMTAVSMLLGVLSQLGTLILSAYLIAQGSLTAGALFGIVQTSGQMINPIQALSANIPRIRGSKEVIERLMSFIHSNANDKDQKVATFNEEICVRNFSYTYPGQETAAVKKLDVIFEKNKKYVIVGQSGCGKTTLAKALIGYLYGYQGQILYDEYELQELTSENLSEFFTIVHQNVYMFDETIEQNIKLHRAYKESEMRSALVDSGVALFLLNDDKTLQTEVGENGSNLSGGQRQRIAIARALIRNKPLLILDEGTSALDKQTATDIENRLLNHQDLTLLTITHTLDAHLLEQYDEVIYMEEGTIIERGSFSELMGRQGRFSQYLND